MSEELKPLPCPFCGGEPTVVARPDNIDGTEFYAAVACYCGGYSACAHKGQRCKTQDEALADTISAWNRRAQPEPAAPSVAPEPREQQTQKSINLLRSALLRIEQAQSIHTAHALAESALRKWRSQNGEGHENCDV